MIFKNKIYLIIIIIYIIPIVLIGCKKDYNINVIEEEMIMLQEEKEYYVYFYKDNCSYCDQLFDIVNKYLEEDRSIPLYICKLKPGSKIDRISEGSVGQGPDGKYYVDHVISYDRLYIAGVPSLIKVKFNGVHNECFYVSSGKNNIIEYFEKLDKE